MPEPTKPLLTKLANGLKNWFKKPAEPRPYKLDVSILEDRILYSATAMPMPDAAPLDPSILDMEAIEAALQSALTDVIDTSALQAAAADASRQSGLQILNSVNDTSDWASSVDTYDATLGDNYADLHESNRHEVAFIDARLDDLEQLISELKSNAADNVNLEIVLLDQNQDGILAIGQFLSSSHFDFDAVHIVTHGNANGFQLGSIWLDSAASELYVAELALWREGFTSDADLLIYGCSVASSSDSQQWLADLSAKIEVDIAASDDLTGNVLLGGDWELEYVLGGIETRVLNAASDNDWLGILATYTVTNTNDSGAGSLRQAITDANNNAGTDTIQFSVGSGGISINLSSALPTITGTIVIDGWTQSGYSSTPIVVLDGNGLTGDGLVLAADNSTIRGLVIRDFNGDGIQVNLGSDGNTIAGNYIGSYASSGGNLGSGETNTGNGINILGANNIIGGTTASLRNVIAETNLMEFS